MKNGIETLDPETLKKKFNQWMKRQKAKPTAKELEEIKKLEKEALRLWKLRVKERAGRKCENPKCKKTKYLNAHHVESFITNKALRYDVMNGVCLCPTCHKFGWLSAHKSFCFLYTVMQDVHPTSLHYLLDHYQDKVKLDKHTLESIIYKLKTMKFPKVKRKLIIRTNPEHEMMEEMLEP